MPRCYEYKPIHAANCRECGERFKAKTFVAEFCSGKCRNDYNNRRAVRGMIVYDCIMSMLYEPKTSRGMWNAIRKLAASWKKEDVEKRRGFKSWRDPDARIERNPYLVGEEEGRI